MHQACRLARWQDRRRVLQRVSCMQVDTTPMTNRMHCIQESLVVLQFRVHQMIYSAGLPHQQKRTQDKILVWIQRMLQLWP